MPVLSKRLANYGQVSLRVTITPTALAPSLTVTVTVSPEGGVAAPTPVSVAVKLPEPKSGFTVTRVALLEFNTFPAFPPVTAIVPVGAVASSERQKKFGATANG